MNKKVINALIMLLIPIVIWYSPAPEGLADGAWKLFGFYLAAIVGLILKPFPAPVVVLSAIAGSALFLGNTKAVLSGYATTTAWLVFSAFALSVAFVKTGLGRRIAYHLINAFGGTVLRLGYVTALLDFVVSPATPSNTARCSGIVFPIMNAVAKSLGSEPGETANKAGRFLMVNTYMVTKVTSLMFLTAMAPNALAGDFMAKMLGVHLDWGLWALAMIVPGIAMLLVVPYITYLFNKPTMTTVDNKKIAAEGLAELGPMSGAEKTLVGIFIFALLGWALPSILAAFGIKFKIDATAVAIVSMVASFCLGAIKWDDMVANKGGWNTLMWFGGIIGLSDALSKAKFFEWLAEVMQTHLHFGDNGFVALVIIGIISVAIRYLFASGSAYVVAMLPVFLAVGPAAGVNPMALALVLCASNSYGGALTHYGGAAAPIVFGAGYNDVKDWWITGGVVAIVCLVLTFVIGYPWWGMLGIL